MLTTLQRKTTYWLFAAAASFMLLATPFVIQSVHAGGCEGVNTPSCPG